MPKIPLYNKAGPSQVPLATGQLGARAGTDVFTAPARQMAALGETIGRVGRQYAEGELRITQNKQRFDAEKAKIDFDFKMAEKEREEKTTLKEVTREAQDIFGTMLIEDTSRSVTEAETKFDKEFEKFADNIRGRGYTPRFEQVVLNAAQNVFASNRLGAKQKAFDTGTKIATDTDNQFLDDALQTLRTYPAGSPERDLVTSQVNDIFTTAANENRKLKYTPQSFSLTSKLEAANAGFQDAANPADVDATLKVIIDDETIPPAKKAEALGVARETKERLATELYDTTLETIIEADLSSAEASDVYDGFTKGEDFTITRANGDELPFSVRDMPIGRRNQIRAEVESIGKEFTQETRNLLAGEIAGGYDAEGLAGLLSIATNIRDREDISEEDADAAILSQARRFAADAQAAYDAGNYDNADSFASASQLLLNETFGGATSLRDKTGAVATSANSIFTSTSAVMANSQGKRVEAAQVSLGVSFIEGGVFDSLGSSLTTKQANAALEVAMAGKSLPQQFEILEQNNLVYDPIKDTIDGAAVEGRGATPDMGQVMKGLELFRQAKLRGGGVLNNHADEDSQAFFNSVLALESVGVETEDAIRKVSLALKTEIDINAAYKNIKPEVDRILDGSVFEIFGVTLSGETITNRSYLHQKLEDLSKIYIGHGLPRRDAVKKAAEQMEASHINLRGMYIPRSRSYPQDLTRMADLAAADFIAKNPNMADEQVSIFPTPGRADEWNVMVNGTLAPTSYDSSVYTLEDLQGLLAGDKKTNNLELIQRNLEERGLTTIDQVQDEFQRLNREANRLTGGTLARIRREEGEAAADAAIAKRTQLQNEAELVRQLLLDLRKAESGS
jgi:hypothetical protein